MAGISLLQGGIGLCLSNQEQINELFSSNSTSNICMKEVIPGLDIFGLTAISSAFSVLRHFFMEILRLSS